MSKIMSKNNYIRFDWAIKRLLRNKTDFVVVNGFLSSLLGEPVSIVTVLESESNKTSEEDKFNRTDILVEDSKKRKIIIEIQNNSEFDFFHRMLYGVSKVVTEYIKEGEMYITIGKVYSINIMYFAFGQGKGCIYHGTTNFRNVDDPDELLQLSNSQLKRFEEEQVNYQEVHNIYPEYYVLKVNKFNDVATTPLSEWIYFLKHSEIPVNFTAPGLNEARKKLTVDNLSPEEYSDYKSHLKSDKYEASAMLTAKTEGEIAGEEKGIEIGIEIGKTEGIEIGKMEGIEIGKMEGIEIGKMEIVSKLYTSGMSIEQIRQITDFSHDKIREILGIKN
jgi:predicted transposase/invertase (TIGR01784 family)